MISRRELLIGGLGGAVGAALGAGFESRRHGNDPAKNSDPGNPDHTFSYKEREITISDNPGFYVLYIDKVPVDVPIGITSEYTTRFFPHQTFGSMEEIAVNLVDTEGVTWIFTGEGIDLEQYKKLMTPQPFPRGNSLVPTPSE